MSFQIIFTVEAIARIATYIPAHFAYRDVFVILDIATVLPFWIRVIFYNRAARGMETAEALPAHLLFA